MATSLMLDSRRFDLTEQLRHAARDLEVHDNLDDVLIEARTLLVPDYALHTGSW